MHWPTFWRIAVLKLFQIPGGLKKFSLRLFQVDRNIDRPRFSFDIIGLTNSVTREDNDVDAQKNEEIFLPHKYYRNCHLAFGCQPHRISAFSR
jgi:hypothetical protein